MIHSVCCQVEATASDCYSVLCVLFAFCTGTHGSLFPDRIPPTTQARTWVCSNSKQTPWSVLPLHKALAHAAPYKVVERLVKRTFSLTLCDGKMLLSFHAGCAYSMLPCSSLPRLGAVPRVSGSFSNRDCRHSSLPQQSRRLFVLRLPRSSLWQMEQY